MPVSLCFFSMCRLAIVIESLETRGQVATCCFLSLNYLKSEPVTTCTKHLANIVGSSGSYILFGLFH